MRNKRHHGNCSTKHSRSSYHPAHRRHRAQPAPLPNPTPHLPGRFAGRLVPRRAAPRPAWCVEVGIGGRAFSGSVRSSSLLAPALRRRQAATEPPPRRKGKKHLRTNNIGPMKKAFKDTNSLGRPQKTRPLRTFNNLQEPCPASPCRPSPQRTQAGDPRHGFIVAGPGPAAASGKPIKAGQGRGLCPGCLKYRQPSALAAFMNGLALSQAKNTCPPTEHGGTPIAGPIGKCPVRFFRPRPI